MVRAYDQSLSTVTVKFRTGAPHEAIAAQFENGSQFSVPVRDIESATVKTVIVTKYLARE